MLIDLDRGHFFLIFLHWRAKLLAPDWLSAPFLHLVGFLKSFVQNFLTQRSLQILTFKPTYSVEMHGNQAIAGRECKKGEPKSSHTDSKRLFVLKAKTWCLCVFEEIRLSSSSTFVSSLRLPTSQTCCKLRKTAQSFLKEIVNILFNGLKEPVKVSGRNCCASSFGLVICSFYRYV